MLQAIQEIDFSWSQLAYTKGADFVSQRVLHGIGWTGEGYFWLPGPAIFAWYCGKGESGRAWGNLLLINLIDIVLIAVSKYIFARPRPNYEATNKTAAFLGPDQHSFPSGHTSRSISIALVFSLLYPSSPLTLASYLWAVTVTFSRLLVGRHYIGDLIGGGVLACINMAIFARVGPIEGLWDLFALVGGK